MVDATPSPFGNVVDAEVTIQPIGFGVATVVASHSRGFPGLPMIAASLQTKSSLKPCARKTFGCVVFIGWTH